MNSSFRLMLYGVCALTDFGAFIVIFAVSRGLAEQQMEPWYLGVVGAGLSFSAGVGSILGGWLSHRFDGRVVFVTGTALLGISTCLCASGDPASVAFLPGYWLLGIGLGCIYPPLVGWLNQGESAHTNRRGVSRTLILYCIAWNLGMMCGQLTAGTLFAWSEQITFGAAISATIINFLLSIVAARRVVPLYVVARDVTPGEPEAVELASAFKRLSWLANLGGMFGGSLVIHLLPDLAVTIGIPAADHGKLLASWRAVIIGTYLLMHISAFWHYRFGISVTSQIVAAIGLLIVSQATSALSLLIGLAMLGQLVGYNYFSGLFYSTAGSSHERRALAAGIHEATLATGMAIGTIVGGVLATLVNQRVPYLLAAIVLVVQVMVQWVAWHHSARSLYRHAFADANIIRTDSRPSGKD